MRDCKILDKLCCDCPPPRGLADALPVPRPAERVSTREIVQAADDCYLRPKADGANRG